MTKVGIGQDSHRFDSDKNKSLVLGGVKISETGGLKANSDGDVVIHSLCNALSSAIGGDSLGTWADKMCLEEGIKDSSRYLKDVFNKIKILNLSITNISISVEAKTPRLSLKIIDEIKNNLSKLLEINVNQIGITFTSGEGLTAFGRGKGIQVFSIVSLGRIH